MQKSTRKKLLVGETSRPFPPRRDFASLSLRDLLDAREAYHVYLSTLENVVATAIGRYRIHEKDWNATHAPDTTRPDDYPRVTEPRTLGNSIVTPWSWPTILVFVREWDSPEKLGNQLVPRSLYLPDGRVIPTCVIQTIPDESLPPSIPGPSQVSPLLGGGYACLREHQGVKHFGTFGCLAYKDGSYYVLTNRHVAGRCGDVIQAYLRGSYNRVGTCSDIGVNKRLFSEVFPAWPGDKTFVALDAGLVYIDQVDDWTSQVFGIGEIGLPFDATEQTITLDLIGCPVRAFGGTSGVIEGEIQALFFRYASLGGFDYTTDILVGPRTGIDRQRTMAPFTRPGDSGTLWFYDPPSKKEIQCNGDFGEHLPPERGARARRLQPVAMQWGGERFRESTGLSSAFALGSFLSTICHSLEIQISRDWSTGYDEYWGKLAHFAIGWKACELLSGNLSTLMKNNQARIGFGDRQLGEGSYFRMGRNGFVPLADVPDYVWVNSRPNESIQHFADADIYDINGGPSLLQRCIQDPRAVSARVWEGFFQGFADAGVGPDEGALPFRVWQIWDAMVGYLKTRDVIHFVAAAGVLAHYIGDASQPFHCSYMHHGLPPMVKHEGREYPARRDTPEFEAFKNSREYKIHSIYDETVLEVDTPAALAKLDQILSKSTSLKQAAKTGYDAAVATIRLMDEVQRRLAPKAIIAADDPELGPKARAKVLWENGAIQGCILDSLAESVRLLAGLWSSAWKIGGGGSIEVSKLVTFEETDIENIYRRDKDFVPSLSLTQMSRSGKFEPDRPK